MPNTRLKLVLPQGIQFEAEGTEEFIAKEKELFLKMLPKKEDIKDSKPPDTTIWQSISLIKGNTVILKSKHSDITPAGAALLILAVNRIILQSEDCSALKLSKSLKKSGYFKGRIDRIIAGDIKGRTISAIGTKRNRTYQLTPKGIAKAQMLAEKIQRQ